MCPGLSPWPPNRLQAQGRQGACRQLLYASLLAPCYSEDSSACSPRPGAPTLALAPWDPSSGSTPFPEGWWE